MDKKYIELFKEVAHATEVLAERVKDFEYKDKTEDGEKAAAAETLRQQYAELYDKLRADDFDDTTLTRNEFARLFLGASIVVGNLKSHVKDLNSAINGYENRVMPMLKQVFDESEDDAGAQKLAQELFTISQESDKTE